MLANREEFAGWFNNVEAGFGDPDSPLWEAERDLATTPQWFLLLSHSVGVNTYGKAEYWEWCHKNMRGKTRCYSSSDTEEWWGFTNQDDIMLWVLRWA